MLRRTALPLLAVFLFAVAAPPVAAQDDDFRLLRWRGGSLEADLSLGLDLLGGGTGPATLGGVMSRRASAGAMSLFANPAELAALQTGQFTADAKVGLATSTFGLRDALYSDDDVMSDTDEFLVDFEFPDVGRPLYTEIVSAGASQPGRLTSFGLAVPVGDRFVVAFGARTPVDIDLDVRVAGMEAYLDASRSSGDQTIAVNMLMRFGMVTRARLQMNALSLGAGGTVFDGDRGTLLAGAALTRYHFNSTLRLEATPEGVVTLSRSRQFFFNDAGDPNLAPGETNALYWRGSGDFSARAWGFRAGASYSPRGSGLGVSVAFNHVPSLRLEDPGAFAESYVPVFLNLEGQADPEEGEEELLDVEQLNLAKPNLTKQTKDSLGQAVQVDLPSTFTLGLDVPLGRHTIALNYVQYIGDLAYGFTYTDEYRIGKSLGAGFRYGVDIALPEGFGLAGIAALPLRLLTLDVDGLLFQAFGKWTGYGNPRFRFGGGIALGDGIAEGFEDATSIRDGLGAPLPTGISLGRAYTLRDRVDVGVMVFGYPDLVFRVGVAYSFD